jgi:hypothetical protein
MSAVKVMPQATSLPQQTKQKRNWLSEVKTKGAGLPSRIVVHAVEKFGKTSFAAQIPGVLFGMPITETGLQPLLDSGILKDVPYLPPWETWEEVIETIDFLIDNEHQHKALAIDTGNGVEKLLHNYICRRDYGGKYDSKGFLNYMAGFEVAVPELKIFLGKLDKLREVRKVRPVILVHTAIREFKNPEGPNFDRYETAMHPKAWEAVKQWADCILFGNFHTVTKEEGNRVKGVGGDAREFYTTRTAAYDAGNRLGLTKEIDCGSSAAEAWANFTAAVKAARGTTAA